MGAHRSPHLMEMLLKRARPAPMLEELEVERAFEEIKQVAIVERKERKELDYKMPEDGISNRVVIAMLVFGVAFMQLSEAYPAIRRATPLINGLCFMGFLVYGCKTLVD